MVLNSILKQTGNQYKENRTGFNAPWEDTVLEACFHATPNALYSPYIV